MLRDWFENQTRVFWDTEPSGGGTEDQAPQVDDGDGDAAPEAAPADPDPQPTSFDPPADVLAALHGPMGGGYPAGVSHQQYSPQPNYGPPQGGGYPAGVSHQQYPPQPNYGPPQGGGYPQGMPSQIPQQQSGIPPLPEDAPPEMRQMAEFYGGQIAQLQQQVAQMGGQSQGAISQMAQSIEMQERAQDESLIYESDRAVREVVYGPKGAFTTDAEWKTANKETTSAMDALRKRGLQPENMHPQQLEALMPKNVDFWSRKLVGDQLRRAKELVNHPDPAARQHARDLFRQAQSPEFAELCLAAAKVKAKAKTYSSVGMDPAGFATDGGGGGQAGHSQLTPDQRAAVKRSNFDPAKLAKVNQLEEESYI